MKKIKKHIDRIFANHPRYGCRPIPSSEKHSAEEIERSHWHYVHLEYFAETAIVADVEKQNYATFSCRLYIDIAEQCEICRRPFLFFALEQKYWFETLGFWVDAHCTRCCDCRRKEHDLKSMRREYQLLIGKSVRSESENEALRQLALELYQLGYIRDIEKINSKAGWAPCAHASR